MIGSLRGKLIKKQPPHIYIDVSGVGYELEAPMTTFYQLPKPGHEVHIFTHLVVREDAQLLFGFAAEEDRRLFRALIKVNGVGPKMALTILSGIEVDDLTQTIKEGNTERLVRLPGVGKKTAERLIVEMRDRLKDWQLESRRPSARETGGRTLSSEVDDAVSALIALGYKPQEASRFVQAVAGEDMDSETLIREALKVSVR